MRIIAVMAAFGAITFGFPAVAWAMDIQGTLDQMFQRIDTGDVKYGVMVYDLTNRLPLAEINADKPLTPASNMKVITTAAALLALGPGFEFRTQLLRDGETLILQSDGDPGLGDPHLLEALGIDHDRLLDSWVEQVQQSGLTQVKSVIVDDRAFDRNTVHPNWPQDQLDKWYCAPVAALNFNDNCVELYTFPASRLGEPPRVHVTPVGSPIDLRNRAKTSNKDSPWATRLSGTNQITVHGRVQKRRVIPIEVTVHDPPMFLGGLLANRLKAAGVPVEQVRRVRDEEQVKTDHVLATVRTPIEVVVRRANTYSQNMFAEALVKRMGLHATGQPGSWPNGTAAMRVVMSNLLGPNAAEMVIDDGSGLSSHNRVSPRLLALTLALMYESPELSRIYVESLAVPGEPGTLAKRHSDYDAHVRAKSGSINGVVAFSGYVLPESGRVVAFSILINNHIKPKHEMKRFLDDVVGVIDEQLAKDAERAKAYAEEQAAGSGR